MGRTSTKDKSEHNDVEFGLDGTSFEMSQMAERASSRHSRNGAEQATTASRCSGAAIYFRLQELSDYSDRHAERRALLDAIKSVRTLQREKLHYPDSTKPKLI